MKTIIFSVVASILLLAACTNGKKTIPVNTASDSTASTMAVADSKTAGNVPTQALIMTYLQLKNALSQDNDKDAADAGKNLAQAISTLDKASLSEGQSKTFAAIADDAKEHAEHIGANAGNIKHQREHFETLSQDIYELVKAGGSGGQKLYFDHCPMYNEGKGGNWISETKEIQNPYLGKSMPDCGTVKEELK